VVVEFFVEESLEVMVLEGERFSSVQIEDC